MTMTTPTVHLERYETGASGTWGRLWIEGPDVGDSLCLHILEPPWADNRPRVSCIPAGRYRMVLGYYHHGRYPAWEIIGVPGRSEIKLHRGRIVAHTKGCPLEGRDRTGVELRESEEAHEALMAALAGIEKTWITITWRTPDIAPSDRWWATRKDSE